MLDLNICPKSGQVVRSKVIMENGMYKCHRMNYWLIARAMVGVLSGIFTKLAKVMFLHMSVILFTGGGVSRPIPRRDVGWGGVLPGGVSRPRPWGVCIPTCTEADTPQQMATAADDTYTTGMHSCFQFKFNAAFSNTKH